VQRESTIFSAFAPLADKHARITARYQLQRGLRQHSQHVTSSGQEDKKANNLSIASQ